MTFTVSAPFVIALALAFVRSVAFVSVCPPFSNASIPTISKIGFAGAISVFAAGTLQHDVLPQGDVQLIVEIVIQATVGVVLGFVVSLFVTTVVGAGSLIDLFAGLNLPQAIDPLSQQQTKIFGQFYNLLLMALLFTTGSVVVIVEGFVKSFQSVGTSLPSTSLADLAQIITSDVVTFFAAALEMAAPLVVVLFCTQILLALLAKAAPQVNVFVLGMPLQILVALLGVGVAIIALPSDVMNLVGRAMAQLFGG
ncbi:MAG TPA: flagellar biosynthetic protein FliR [Acidimicrobiales bacterium]|jgi:flagellar biosynthetic protein FliR|nr:flagellar biosynthetic protein FliR [Acidimicrobiales bacterium]